MKKAIAIILSIMLVLSITLSCTALSSIAVKSIKLNNSKITLKVGETSNLKVTFTPANSSQKKLTYVTGNKRIAIINTAGKITGVSRGTTTITVYTTNKKIFARCNVTIQARKTQTLTYATYNGWGSYASLKLGVSMYEKETGNKIEYQLYPDDQFQNLIRAKIATGDVPDLIGLHNNASKVPADEMVPLDGPWVANLDEAAKMMGSRSSDGKLISAIYVQMPYAGIFYNKVVFKKCGLKPPFKTFDEFINACEIIKKTGVEPMAIAAPWHSIWMINAGAHYIFDNDPTLAEKMMKNKVKPQDVNAIVDLYNRLVSIRDKGLFNKDYMNATDFDKKLFEGKFAMLPRGSWDYSMYKKDYGDNVDEVIGMMPMTFGDNNIAVVGRRDGRAFMIPKASKKIETAKEFINFILQEKVLKAMFELDPGTCPYRGVETALGPWDKEMAGYIAAGIPSKDEYTAQYFLGFDMDAGYNPAEKIIAGKSVKDALTEWYEAYAQIAKAKGISGF